MQKKKETIANTSESQFNTEFNCEFLGSIDTLITPSKLKTLTYKTPIQSNAGLDIYHKPKEKSTYILFGKIRGLISLSLNFATILYGISETSKTINAE